MGGAVEALQRLVKDGYIIVNHSDNHLLHTIVAVVVSVAPGSATRLKPGILGHTKTLRWRLLYTL